MQQGNGMAVAALVLGICGIVFSFLFLLGIPLGVLAVVFGIVGRRRAKTGRGGGGMAAWGVGLGVAALVFSVIGLVMLSDTLEELDEQGVTQTPAAP